MAKSVKSVTPQIYKKDQFDLFIKHLRENGQSAHWQEVAQALGVSRDTIQEWRKLPEAIQAKNEGIAKTMSAMETVGYKDWRMHAEKLKMLGVAGNKDEELTGNKANVYVLAILQAAGLTQEVENLRDGKTLSLAEGSPD